MTTPRSAVRIELSGSGNADFSGHVVRTARRMGLEGWVRDDGGVARIHAEGAAAAVQALVAELGGAGTERVKPEGHEQFAIRGVSAGIFVVQEHHATAWHFDLRLEVGGMLRSWAVPKGPSLDPAQKRMAIGVADHDLAHADHEDERTIVWDRGTYEQGGRVAWPEALDRGHAVFVLHGSKLHGGFALQRTRGGAKPQWLLIKRRDDEARSGTDVVAERPESVLSGRTLP